jgi:hypothetical protein
VEGASVGECGRSDPGFAVVASNGAGGRHGERQGGAGTREVHDADRFYRGRNVPSPRRDTPTLTRGTASSLDRRARRENPRRTGGQRRARMVARARTPRGVGADFKGLGVLPTSGRSGLKTAQGGPDADVGAAHARARSALWPARCRGVVPKLIHCLKWKSSKNLNRSAQSGE